MKTAYTLNLNRSAPGSCEMIDLSEYFRFSKMPSIRCPICGPWATTGIYYPSVQSLEIKALFEQYETIRIGDSNVRFLPPEEFKKLAGKVGVIIGDSRPLGPAAGLGPLSGSAKRISMDFPWIDRWIVLARETVMECLLKEGFQLTAIRANFEFVDGPSEPLYEIEAIPLAQLIIDPLPEPCEICGRSRIKMPDRLLLDSSSYDNSIPIQRISNLPTFFVVNEEFKQLYEKKGWNNLVFTELEVS